MVRNATKSDLRTSKMAAGSHFVKKITQQGKNKKVLHIDLKWPEMCSKVNFGHPKWAQVAIL